VRAAEDVVVLEVLRNVLYILQRNKKSKDLLDQAYRRRAIDSHLRSVPIFADLQQDPREFERFVSYFRERVRLVRLDPGNIIFRQNDAADSFYLVRTGFVKVSQKQPGGEHVLSYVGPGGFIGEIGLMSHLPELAELAPPGVRTASCSALDHVDLVRISAEDFQKILDEFPAVRERLVKIAVERLEENEQARQRADNVPLGEFLRQGLMNAQSLLVLDLEKCTRCDECTKACADAHDGVTRLVREGLRFDKYLVASSCRSCLDPYCMVGCPVGSIRRRNSREIIIEDWCIGCGKCAENCPYGNINMHPFPTGQKAPDANGRMVPVVQQKATMCDLCSDLRDGQPSCVYACPHDAAHRMTGEALIRDVEQRMART
jgi:Fe-S-cluster-containing hydrogenase component 2/CRP-like cAMP-binding protein